MELRAGDNLNVISVKACQTLGVSGALNRIEIRLHNLTVRTSSKSGSVNLRPYEQAVDLLLEIRKDAKGRKDWATSDLIRNRLSEIGFDVKDTKDGFEWKVK